jgi:hypothetical protein
MRYRQILTGQPSIEIYIQHVLSKSGGVSADADQQPSLGGLADDPYEAYPHPANIHGKMPATWSGSVP